MFDNSTVYPGVMEGLQRLRENNVRLACITNKIRRFTEPLMEKSGLRGFFDVVICGDDYARMKPDPLPLLKAAERLNIAPAKALMVGDSSNDIKAGSRAGFKTACVSNGYPGKYSAEDLKADFRLRTLADLL